MTDRLAVLELCNTLEGVGLMLLGLASAIQCRVRRKTDRRLDRVEAMLSATLMTDATFRCAIGATNRDVAQLKTDVRFVRDQIDDLADLMPDDPCAEPDSSDFGLAVELPPGADVFDDEEEEGYQWTQS